MSSSVLSLPALPSSQQRKSSEIEGHSDVPYSPLTTDDSEQHPLAQGEGEEGAMGLKEAYQMPEGRPGDATAQLVAIVAVGGPDVIFRQIFFISTWLIALVDPSSYGLFTWHPLLMSLGIVLFSYGILTLQPTSRPKTKASGLVRHQLAMFVLGYPAVLLAFGAIWYNKYRGGHSHFTTWHGLFGIISISLSILQVGLGAGSVWFDGKLFGGNPRAKLVWKYHRALGYINFPLYIFTAYLGGAWSNWTALHSVFVVRLFAYWIAPFVLIGALFSRMRLSKMNFSFF
ncbi:hypothetical protein QCA50_002861 [Cerrena zonata]|uniref:Cytochrome b561 domain-containing protein n=1 Tax=Cerrena zonata TaxID=2478898 RepID=A0AAW0GUZ4_9APHY